MCIVLNPAHLTDTIIYTAEVQRPDTGEVLHVIGYQNNVDNTRSGPNAMILPLPVRKDDHIGPGNIVDTRDFAGILRDYGNIIESFDPELRLTRGIPDGIAMPAGAAEKGYEVFDSGNYTVALAHKPSALPQALAEVPTAKRPEIPTKFVIALSKLYADWPIAVCCFNGSVVKNPEPLLWWFRPRFPKVLFAPAIDAHDGNPPNIEDMVNRDHILAFSSFRMSGKPVSFIEAGVEQEVPIDKRWLFNPRMKGRVIKHKTGNGDFTLPISALTDDTVPEWLPHIDVTLPPRDPISRYEHVLNDNVL